MYPSYTVWCVIHLAMYRWINLTAMGGAGYLSSMDWFDPSLSSSSYWLTCASAWENVWQNIITTLIIAASSLRFTRVAPFAPAVSRCSWSHWPHPLFTGWATPPFLMGGYVRFSPTACQGFFFSPFFLFLLFCFHGYTDNAQFPLGRILPLCPWVDHVLNRPHPDSPSGGPHPFLFLAHHIPFPLVRPCPDSPWGNNTPVLNSRHFLAGETNKHIALFNKAWYQLGKQMPYLEETTPYTNRDGAHSKVRCLETAN